MLISIEALKPPYKDRTFIALTMPLALVTATGHPSTRRSTQCYKYTSQYIWPVLFHIVS